VQFALAAVLTLAIMPVTTFAAADDPVWVAAVGNDSVSEQNVTASVVTDAAVTDGVIELTYDSTKLTYDSVSVNEDYVEMYAVNADEDGVVKISWIAGDVPEADGTETAFIKVVFTGDTDGVETFTVSGDAYVYENGTAQSEKVQEVRVEKSETVETEETETTDESETETTDESETKETTANGSKPSDKNHNGSNKDKTNGSNAVKTGDETPVALYVVGMVAAVAVIAGIFVAQKRRKAK
jgi:LPXTG-motif cell wall-anchored protein